MPMDNLETRLITKNKSENCGEKLNLIFLSDFGQMYTAATLAGAHTIVADHNFKYNSNYSLETIVTKQYKSFDIAKAIPQFKSELEQSIKKISKGEKVAAALVVDPAKNRINVLSKWIYDGIIVYLAHPDHGQVTEFINDEKWELLGAVEIDVEKIVPDYELTHEDDQLWDGHVAYVPAAVTAMMFEGKEDIFSVGKSIDSLKKYKCEEKYGSLDEDDFENVNVPFFEPVETKNESEGNIETIVHYMGDNFENFVKQTKLDGQEQINFVDYGVPESIDEASAFLFFAAINIFQDVNVTHIIYSDTGEHNKSEYLRAKFKDKNIIVIAPNDESITPLLSYVCTNGGNPYFSVEIHEFGYKRKLLTEEIKKKEIKNSDQDIKTNGFFKVKDENEGYIVPVFSADANGNVRLFFNPTSYGIDFYDSQYSSVDVWHEERYIGEFNIQKDYYPKGNEQQGPYLGAIENPAHGSRRSMLELFAAFDALTPYFAEKIGHDNIKPGTKLKIKFK